MEIKFETLWPLLFLLTIPAFWWARRSTQVDLARRHLLLSTAVRSALIVLLVLVLTQPTLRRADSQVSVVYALDVSHSIAPAAVADAMKWIEKTNATAKPRHAAYVAFAANARVFPSLEELRKAPVAMGRGGAGTRGGSRGGPATIDQSGTDLAAALESAARSLDPGSVKRIVLLSDGNGTSGDLASVLSRLRADKMRVHTQPLNVRANRDVWVEGVTTPVTVTADEQFPLEVQVYSQLAMEAVVELKDGAKTLGKRSTRLAPGLNRVAFETLLPDSQVPVVLEASVAPAEDTFTANNAYREAVTVTRRPAVLYVEGRAASARYLREALAIEGFHVDLTDAQKMPSSAAALDRYDLIVVSDVEGKMFSPAQMGAIATYVRELGGGLILACGENIYGQGGYSKTQFEEALPVTFDVSKKKPPTVAMLVVMDNSGSMSGQKIELAKMAASAPLSLLRDTDRFGVMTFNTVFTWVTPLGAVTDRPGITTAISSIGARGGTDGYPAMDAALQSLTAVSDEIKTVLFMTDGRTVLRDYKTLTSKMLQSGIHVTTVAIGRDADRELLADISMWGKGRAYFVESPNNVPQIFVRETELAMDKALHEAPFNLLVRKSVSAFKGIDFQAAPNLLGYVATKPKPTAEVLLSESIGGDPVLARWQYGLGKTALFASDLKDRWAANWLQWDGYPKFWSQLVRETMRRNSQDFDLHVERTGERGVLTVNAIGKDGFLRNALHVQARMTGPGPRATVVDLPQVGPGLYETQVRLDPATPYSFGAEGEPGAQRAKPYSYPEEFRFHPTDIAALEGISKETGGKFEPTAADVVNTHGETVETVVLLWPWLAALALAGFVTDILLRRLRLFEGVRVKSPSEVTNAG